MYKSPIELFESPVHDVIKQMYEEKENYIYQCIADIGVNIDKDELIKALQYDREQYEQGYRDGRQANKWIKINSDFDLPDNRGDYIVYTGNDSTPEVIALYYCGDDNWDDGTGIAKGSWYGVSHWQPLPTPPKKEELL